MNSSRVGERSWPAGARLKNARLTLLAASLFALAGISCEETSPAGPAQPPTVAPPPPGLSVEDEVLGNILRQPIGRHSVADLNLPEAFLRREADRIIRSSFEDQYRIVVRDAAARTVDAHVPAPGSATSPTTQATPQAAPGAIALFEPPLSPTVLEYRRSLPQGRPSNRGFMVRLREDDPAWPFDEPGDSSPQALRDAAEIVAKRLAFDGLLPTLTRILATLGPQDFLAADDEALVTLRETGLPIDLLRHFAMGEDQSDRAIIQHIAKRLRDGIALDEIIKETQDAAFAFRPTCPGFAAASEGGEIEPGAIRAQMTRGGYWKGEGDGGNADLLRQCIDALPDACWFISIEVKHAREFAESASAWGSLQREGQMTIVPEPIPVAQWAQDNGKTGVIADTNNAPRLALLVPRYASWGDDGSTFVPGENFLLPGAAGAIGAELVHSPLLFQGGNVLCVNDPRSGERWLLISEADIYRNVSLGLSLQQVLEAFRVEFGVDRCEMLPAISFHLDYDVSVRAVGSENDGRLVAMLNDPIAAANGVLATGAEVLQRAGLVDAVTARDAIVALRKGQPRGYLERIAPVVYSIGQDGRFPLSLAERFSTSLVDSGVGNLQRFLLALDLFVSGNLSPDELPGSRHARSYLQSLQRREKDRAALAQRLRELGMQVVAVPSMSDATRSISAINGVHVRDAYLMPAYGGLYRSLDETALASVRAALGENVRVIPIICGESQRRCGAIHCSLSIFPTLPATRD